VGTNASELGRTLKYLKDNGRLETIDAALVQAARSLASAVDAEPDNASLWKQYREAVKDLTHHGRRSADDPVSAQLARLFAGANESADATGPPMGHPEKT
jgi:hypothetical protein